MDSNNILTTFVKPVPDKSVMKMLVHINRILNLKGISFLKYIPFINKLPLVRGLCDITKIVFSKEDEDRLRSCINSDNVVFIGPNHPEFYTDWMLDKEISSRVAPVMASWATHSVVNGMGTTMQNFWLKNNLIAQIPRSGNKEAKNYSVQQAIAGHGVLLHPEGRVGWHSDKIAPLFSGIFEMAYQAYKETDSKKNIYVIPIVWKLSFNKNVSYELHKEINYIQKQLDIKNDKNSELNERLHDLLFDIFSIVSNEHDFEINTNNTVFLKKQLCKYLMDQIATELRYSLTNDTNIDIKNFNKLLISLPLVSIHKKNIKNKLNDLTKIMDFQFELYGNSISQENIAEILKKIRINFCHYGLRNQFHKFIPVPVSSRTAYIQVAEPISINDSIVKGISKEELLLNMRNIMQEKLNYINNKLSIEKKVFFYKNLLV